MSRSRNRRSKRPDFYGYDPSELPAGTEALETYRDTDGTLRVVVGAEEGSVHDPQAEIFEKKGETFTVDLGQRKAVRMCQAGKHDMKPDPSETDFEAEKCSRCPYGRLIRPLREPEGEEK